MDFRRAEHPLPVFFRPDERAEILCPFFGAVHMGQRSAKKRNGHIISFVTFHKMVSLRQAPESNNALLLILIASLELLFNITANVAIRVISEAFLLS